MTIYLKLAMNQFIKPMHNKFTKSILLAVFTIMAITIVTLVSCSKSTQSEQAPIKLTATTFDFIGEEHNKGLDYVYSQTYGSNPKTTLDDVLKATDKYVFEISPITNKSKDDRSTLFTTESRNFIKSTVRSTSIISDRTLLLKKLTPAQFSIIEKLDAVFSLQTYEERQQKITDLTSDALVNLNDNEIVYILCTLSLAKHSVEYWNSSKGKLWMNRFITVNQVKTNGDNNNVKVNKIDMHNVAVADIGAFLMSFPAGVKAGALVGGVTAGIASAGITAGLGAVLGGIAGGTAAGLSAAISASAVVMAAELAADFFGW